MTASSFQIFVLSVLAPEIIAGFSLSRAQLGLIGSMNTLVGGLTAPAAGRITDRIGPRQATLVTIAISAVGSAVMALSPSVWVLGLSAVILGIPQGWGNPATNALIAERVPPGSRGVITGIKQSGVQFGIFLSGLTLPALSGALGWRGAVGVYAGLFALLAVAVRLVLPPRAELPSTFSDVAPVTDAPVTDAPVTDAPVGDGEAEAERWIRLIALFALLAGTVGGATGRFFPLWAQEVVGLSSAAAGLLVALGGLFGMGARVVAGRLTERSGRPDRLLVRLAVVGAAYCVVLALAPRLGAWVLWPATVLNAVGIGAWNAVAMLAVIMAVPASRAGRASGVVILGFLCGLSLGGPLAGYLVDSLGRYEPVWWGCAGLMLIAAGVVAASRFAVTARH